MANGRSFKRRLLKARGRVRPRVKRDRVVVAGTGQRGKGRMQNRRPA
jgi:hypothetical protein